MFLETITILTMLRFSSGSAKSNPALPASELVVVLRAILPCLRASFFQQFFSQIAGLILPG